MDFTMNLHIIDEEPTVNGNILAGYTVVSPGMQRLTSRGNRFSISFFPFPALKMKITHAAGPAVCDECHTRL
jgi:hypothetical protein